MCNYCTIRTHGNRGMSLVELMLVMVILAVVMLAVMSLYVPAHQSTVAQTQVSDVQSNLRLAANRMTMDLLTAGFLVPTNPIIFEASATPTTAENPDDDDFTIRTRAVGNDFARVDSSAMVSGLLKVTVTDPDMVANFPGGSRVRIFEPITAAEVKESTGSDAARAYLVDHISGSDIYINPGSVITAATDVPEESVIIRVKDTGQPPIQTIRYRLNNNALERIVNGTTQFLARNVSAVDFVYDKTTEGRVHRVDITLTGMTRALKDDAISGAKTRQLATTVSLRNIY